MDKDKKESIKKKMFEQTITANNTQRFGLFSQPVGIMVGEDTYTKQKIAKKDAEGRVPTDLPQINTSPCKKGATGQVLFSQPSYITLNDQYTNKKDEGRKTNAAKIKQIHQGLFKGSGNTHEAIRSTYEHMKDYDDVIKSAALVKDGEGRVITNPTNFYTNPPKRGGGNTCPGTLFNKEGFEYKQSDYDAPRKLRLEESKYHKSKLQQGKAFCAMHNTGGEAIWNVQSTYGEEGLSFPSKPPPKVLTSIAEHHSKFKPSNPPKAGYNKTINTFPQYVPNGIDKSKVAKLNVRHTKSYSHQKKWRQVTKMLDDHVYIYIRPSHNNNLSRPTGTISTMTKNLRTEFKSAFKR